MVVTAPVESTFASLAWGVPYRIIDGPPAGLLAVARKVWHPFVIDLPEQGRIEVVLDVRRMSRKRPLRGGLHTLSLGGQMKNGTEEEFRFSAIYNPVSHQGKIWLH